MSAFDIIPIRIVKTVGTPDGIGGSVETEVDIAGSPFEGRFYRSTAGSGYFRQDAAAGATTIERKRILSLIDSAAAAVVQEGMTAIVPPCQATGHRELRGRIQRVGYYDNSVQCDLHTGGGSE